MDALKACATNVQVLTDVDATPVRLYAYDAPVTSAKTPLAYRIAELREKGIVCTGCDDRVWLFGLDKDVAEDMPTDFVLEFTATVAEPGEVPGMNGWSIATTFIHALEGAVSFALLRAYGALKLSAWTWLLPEAGQQTLSVTIQMNHRFSEDGKRLNMATSVRESDISTISHANLGDTCDVVLAPAGLSAKLSQGSKAGSRAAKVPAELRNDQWKTLVGTSLLAEGIKLAEEVQWVSVAVSGASQGVLWPVSLCFLPSRDPGIDQLGEMLPRDCHSWSQNADLEAHGDPLTFAEEWSIGYAEREHAHAMHNATVYEDTAMDDASSAQLPDNSTAFDVTSPPLTHRPDLQAFHGIYPTPPDGLAGHTGPQTQPHSDNLAAQPAETVTQPAFTPSDPSHENTVPILDAMPVAEGDQAQRNHSIVSSIGGQGHDWNRGSSDDLFGDMDDLEYGRDEVGDADFNFFDEPDDVPEKVLDTSLPPAGPDTTTACQDSERNGKDQEQLPEAGDSLDQSEDNRHVHAEQKPDEAANTDELDETLPALAPPYDECADAAKSAQKSTERDMAEASKCDDNKPLSPFGIREALLPPPIPASASQTHIKSEHERRKSSFGPLVFNPSGSIACRSSSYDYSNYRPDERKVSYDMAPTRVPLTETHRSPSSTSSSSSLNNHEMDDEDQSDVDSDVDSLSTSSDSTPMAEVKVGEKPSPATRKRKRTLETAAYCGPQSNDPRSGGRTGQFNQLDVPTARGEQHGLLLLLLGRIDTTDESRDRTRSSFIQAPSDEMKAQNSPQHSSRGAVGDTTQLLKPSTMAVTLDLTVMEVFPELKPEDLVIVSQIVAEQATSATRAIVHVLDFQSFSANDANSEENLLLGELEETVKVGIPHIGACDIPSLALVRESLAVQRPQQPQQTAASVSQARHPPRPPPRIDPTTLGPDILPLPASYIRVQRGDAKWEMVPSALSFWEALGLGPVSGPKDVRHFCISPSGVTPSYQVLAFLQDLKATYECCKFGSMALGTEVVDQRAAQDIDVQTITPVSYDTSAQKSTTEMAQTFLQASTALGVQLAAIAFDDPHRTFVISMVNPFHHSNTKHRILADQCFAVCFLQLSKAYQTAAARIAKRDGKTVSPTSMSDIDFKILPLDLMESCSGLAVPAAHQIAFVAREFYDRCPPSNDATDDPCPMSNAVAPSVELVAQLPKRINFQLTAEPPTDLLHEASVLHIAYATSDDGAWVNAVWHDNTGRYVSNSAFCLQGRSFADVALEVWKRTMQLIKARDVIWRLFIATTGSDGVETSRANCWKDIIAQHTDRKQLLSVTLLHFQPSLSLRILPSLDSAVQPGQGTGSGAPTPVATPLPVNGQVVSTSSPDTVGTGTATVTAPPTPAPSEAASSFLEADPEAHLIETEDETWGMLIDRHVASILRPSPTKVFTATQTPDNIEALSHALIIKRGKTPSSPDNTGGRNENPFPCAGASLIWTLRVRPKGDRQGGGERMNVDEGSARHAEVMLREVLGFFRNLGLLSRIKGLDPSGLVPVHIAAAAQGAEGLNGLLGNRGRGKGELG